MPEPERYARQARFAGIGPDGQARLATASAALVGCGALGSLQAELLVRAGVGRLRIVDRDFVEPSNLQRQVLFTEADAASALPKAAAAAEHLRAVNSGVAIEAVIGDVTPGNVLALLDGCDLLLDGSDNFEVRFLLNDVALRTRRPWIYGACVGAYGVVFPIVPGETACLRCLVREVPAPGSGPTCETAGVIGPAAAAVAALQAAEALKILSGRRDRLRRELFAFDLWQGTQQAVRVRPDPDCPACVRGRLEHLEGGAAAGAVRLCGRNAVQVSPPAAQEVDLAALAGRLGPAGPVVVNPYLVRLLLPARQITVFRDGRAVVAGTEDPAEARALVARYVGG